MLRHTSVVLARAMLVAVMVSGTCSSVFGQSFDRLAIGPQISFRFPVSGELENSVGVGVSYKIGKPKSHDGWSPDLGFGWFGADLAGPLDGHINVRPLLGGAGYTWVRGKFRTHLAAVTGPAFVKVKVNDEERAAYSRLLGVPVVGVDVKNSWAVKPGLRVTYQVRPRIGAFVSSDYELVRPTLQIRTATDTRERKLKADVFSVKMGFVVGVL